ncbi:MULTISPECIES: hypothetical protein [Streptomyces]|uniref:Uncharacterized protein n=2 Tax=Streptomyces TaxID=1883 RepID=A0ABT9L9G7_STRGD|nr:MULTISPECIES: hypothetical protein [Streptomyces]MDP9680337.1 hypothetical protein [Streptomyces griseoviridis]GGT09311.1 hypothetical protein GCM10010240_48390 [Streptomyces griseoviridis]GGU52800.1 hypothetical protein GCM10010259_50060 [Streptomyces daghestanicus]GHI29145.1 hypothetical protein Sdagh_08750 [Streptomyces daghestanicus]
MTRTAQADPAPSPAPRGAARPLVRFGMVGVDSGHIPRETPGRFVFAPRRHERPGLPVVGARTLRTAT